MIHKGRGSKAGERGAFLTRLPDDPDALVDTRLVSAVTSVTRMTIWRWIKNGQVAFPHPLYINGRQYWRAGEIRDWLRAQGGEAM